MVFGFLRFGVLDQGPGLEVVFFLIERMKGGVGLL